MRCPPIGLAGLDMGIYGFMPHCGFGSDVFEANVEVGTERYGHPTPKPMKLMREIVSRCATDIDYVIDPFMGSGTTLRAAKDLGRRAIGIEIEERWCESAARRLEQEVLL